MRLTLELEGEVVGQVATLVIPAQEEDRIGIPYFERPEIEYTLEVLLDMTVGDGKERIRTSMLKYPRST